MTLSASIWQYFDNLANETAAHCVDSFLVIGGWMIYRFGLFCVP
jgi:hypothetical protein